MVLLIAYLRKLIINNNQVFLVGDVKNILLCYFFVTNIWRDEKIILYLQQINFKT